MFPSPTLPWFELARFGRSRLTRVAVVAVMTVPLFYGGLYVWANLHPTQNLDHVRAAVVNHDEIIDVKGPDGEKQPVAVGRQLAGDLVSDDSESNYDWQLTDAADAEQGLADGDYKAVLTIPKNLSSAATSTSGDPSEAVQGNLDLRTNDAVNYINGRIAGSILTAAKSALNAQVTETYLDQVYLSFSDIKMSLDDAADGAQQLASGADDLSSGAGTLSDGADDLAAGNRRLADGASALDEGAGQLAGGLSTLDDRTSTLTRDSRRLADGSRQVADGTARLNTLVQTVTGRIDASTGNADTDVDRLATTLRTLADQCRANPTPGLDCGAIDAAAGRAGDLKAFVRQARDQAHTYSGQSQQLADGAAQVAAGNAQLASSVPQLVGAIGDASSGADQLASATGDLSDGAAAASTGADRLAGGAGDLAGGADQLSSGAHELTTGLRDGSDQIPDYDEDERDQLAEVAATPVTDLAKRAHAVENYGEALAPYFMALALWVGAMAIYLLLRPLSARAIASTTGAVRTALAGLAPGVALSVVQVVLLLALLEGALGIDPANQTLFVGVALATGIVFTAINQMFIALFGGAGRFAAIVFVCLQLTAAGGTYPIETAPSFFGFLHALLPMTYAVHGFRAATAGGTVGVGGDFFALAVFAVLALGVTMLAARRQETVTMRRLYPTLVV